MTPPIWRLEDVALGERFAAPGTLEIGSGITAILGASGAGKTSLVSFLVGHVRPNAGRVRFLAPDAPGRLPLFWAPQAGGLWPGISALRHLELASSGSAGAATPFATAESVLGVLELDHVANAPPERLSAGERGRLAVARALVSGARALVLDEPLSATDLGRRHRCWSRMRELLDLWGTSVVYSTHEPTFVLGWAPRTLALDAGRVVWTGATSELYARAPNAALAWLLGPVNWWPPEDAAPWLEHPPLHPCVRPEGLRVERAPESPISIASHLHAGSHAELGLVHVASGACRRVFVSPSMALEPGERVRLRARP